MSLEQVARRVAAKVYFGELAAARVLGYDGIAAYISAFRAMDKAYAAAHEPERPAVWPRTDITVTGRR
jgi:hypothetical protein